MARMTARELKAGGTERIGRAVIRWEARYMEYTIGGTSVCGTRIYPLLCESLKLAREIAAWTQREESTPAMKMRAEYRKGRRIGGTRVRK